MHFIVTMSYNFVAMSGTFKTKLEAVAEIHERTDETEKVACTLLSLLDIVMGVYLLKSVLVS